MPNTVKSRRPTLDDVAARAGVSAKTVARVANGESGVGDATRERVSLIIREMNFRINHSARALAASRTYSIAIVTGWVPAYYITQMFEAAERISTRHGFQLVLRQIDLVEPGALDSFAAALRRQPVDGALVTAPLCDDLALLDLLENEGIRYVRHSPLHEPERSDAVYSEEAHGARLVIDHLLELGHRRFGLLTGPSGHFSSAVRTESALERLAVAGIAPAEVPVVQISTNSGGFKASFEATAQIMQTEPRPTALFCFNDLVAAGAVAYLQSIGLSAPRDVAVAGFGNADFGLLTTPQITTVRQPNAEMAVAAMEWLTSSPAAAPRLLTLPVDLIARASTNGRIGIDFGPGDSVT
ncbi:MAG: LacI family DNA-binding transcriptional regulator [Novosphingobium sp.]|uniref:LacI family DNA-binding transcriptional regulator n=1 Tax=Novosphingobium sp. TaxID=1874826 RepID=UPI003B9913E7